MAGRPKQASAPSGAGVADAGRRPRVVIASRIFLPEPAAASFRLGALAEALAGEGAEVTVLTTTVPGPMRTAGQEPTAVTIKRFPVLRDRNGYVRGYLHYLTFDVPLAVRLLATRRPDAVVCEPPPTTGVVVRTVCALRRIPYVYYAADLWSDAAAGAGAPALVVCGVRAMERRAVRGAAAVLSVSDGVTSRLQRWRRAGVATVGHGIDTGVFRSDGPAVDQPGPYFLYAGTASEVHGAAVFVDAFRSVLAQRPQARLVFAGQGTDFPSVRAAAAQLPTGAITVLSRMPPGEAAAWMRGAAATLASVRPGLGYDYAVPTKAHASLACGTPVILAGPSPITEALRTETLGWAVAYSPQAVAAAMLEALDEPRSAADVERIAGWAQRTLSAQTTAAAAARVVLASVRRPAGRPRPRRR